MTDLEMLKQKHKMQIHNYLLQFRLKIFLKEKAVSYSTFFYYSS